MQLRKWIVSEWVIIIIINTRRSEVEVNGSPGTLFYSTLLYSTWWGFNFFAFCVFLNFFCEDFRADKRLERQTWWLKLKNPICGWFWVFGSFFVWWRVRGNRENFILSITVSGMVWVSVIRIHIFQPNQRKTIFVVFVSSVVHTHTHTHTLQGKNT